MLIFEKEMIDIYLMPKWEFGSLMRTITNEIGDGLISNQFQELDM